MFGKYTSFKSTIIYACIILACLSVNLINSIAEDRKREVDFTEMLSKVNEIQEIEALVREYASNEFVGEAIVKVEQILIRDIKKDGAKGWFVIQNILPVLEKSKGSVTFKPSSSGIGSYAITEFSNDKIIFSLPLLSGVQVSGEGSKWIANIFQKEFIGFIPTDDVPGGDESVHRFIGLIPLGEDYIVGGSEKVNERLSFALIKDIGYVYLRGTGFMLQMKDNEIIRAILFENGNYKINYSSW